MDALALLCNLYGDGPVTLRRLRAAGCGACSDVERMALGELSELLDMPSEAALRFQREARDLVQRLEVGAVDAEAPAPATPHHPASCVSLRPELLDGLDLGACVKLREFGIDSVEDLAEAETLELAGAMDLGVTRIMRLSFLARRFLDSARKERPQLSSTTLVPHEPPPRPHSEPKARRFSPSESAFTQRTPELEREIAKFDRGQGDDAEESAGPFA